MMIRQIENKVLVTGANGYIGSHTVEYLRALGYTVLTAKRDGTGDIDMDFSNPDQITDISISGIDAVVHTVSPKETMIKSNSYSAILEGVLGIKSILDFCVKNDIPRIIYLSSFHAIGKSSGNADESSVPAPLNDYGMIHYFAEQMVGYYTRTGKLDGSSIRPSNVYGMPISENAAGRWDLTPFSFCYDAVMKSKIILKTSGIQKRNFVHVTNVAKCIRHLIEISDIPVLHCSGPQTLSVREFAQMVCFVAGDVLAQEIQLIMPSVDGVGEEMNFCSRYSQIDQSGQIALETYVRDMCRFLKSQRTATT